MVAPEAVHPEDQQHGAGRALGRGPGRQPQLCEIGIDAGVGDAVGDARSLRRLGDQVQRLRAGVEQVRKQHGGLDRDAARLPGHNDDGQDEQHQADPSQAAHRHILGERPLSTGQPLIKERGDRVEHLLARQQGDVVVVARVEWHVPLRL